jgi:hypothetical protein
MTDSDLSKAIACLRINDVWQVNVSAYLDNSLETAGRFPEKHEVRFKHVIQKSLWGESDGEDEHTHILRAFIELGVRYVSSNEDNGADAEANQLTEKEADGPGILAQIESVYVAEYVSKEDPGEAAIKAFVTRNASFHIWPFWREFVASQCNRMNLPRATLPLHNFGTSGHQEG